MDIHVLQDIKCRIELDNLLKRIHIEEDGEDFNTVRKLYEEATSIARPKAIYKVAYINEKGDNAVNIDGMEFYSRVLRVNLDSVHRVFPYVITCGNELEAWSHKYGDFLEQYWADCIKEMFLSYTIKYFNSHIKHTYEFKSVSSMNPGSLKDWPLSEQKSLFSILGKVHEAIGVTLTDSSLMLPSKSVSGILFPTETAYYNCQLCSRPNCQGRKAPYDEHLYNKKYNIDK